uniref:TELO2 interacting protein 2 n=1 Tax=Kryptolebias marmoratus TaxID=37003 RepID=A0A3Q3BQI5_KRYMA
MIIYTFSCCFVFLPVFCSLFKLSFSFNIIYLIVCLSSDIVFVYNKQDQFSHPHLFLLLRMELSSLLHHLHLSSSPSSGKPRPSPPLPPITELLSWLQKKLIIAADKPSESSSLIGQVEQVFQAADPDWLFSLASDDQDSRWAELQEAYSSVIGALIGCAALPLCEDDCSSLNTAAYQSVPSQAVAVSSALTALLGHWDGGGGAKGMTSSCGSADRSGVFLLQDQAWTSAASRTAARRLNGALLRAGSWTDSAHLLMGDGENRGILGGVLDLLQPQLTKDSWQRCEAVKLVFGWTLLQVTRPFLSPHLPRLLPPSLLLNDHYKPENCMLGVRCLHHIVLNTPAADLRQFNTAEVLYQALFKHLYTSEAAVIQVTRTHTHKPPISLSPASSRRKSCHHDDVLGLVLTHMEVEHKVVLRRVYASALPLYVERMGVAVCRHLRRVERVVLGYLEVRDPPEETSRLKILEALQGTTRGAWPRMACRVDPLLRCLLRLLVDVSSDSSLDDSVRQQLMAQSSASIQLLDACSHGRVQVSHLVSEHFLFRRLGQSNSNRKQLKVDFRPM